MYFEVLLGFVRVECLWVFWRVCGDWCDVGFWLLVLGCAVASLDGGFHGVWVVRFGLLAGFEWLAAGYLVVDDLAGIGGFGG